MSLAVGYPERLLDPAVIDSYYDSYTIFIKDFFKNLQVILTNTVLGLPFEATVC